MEDLTRSLSGLARKLLTSPSLNFLDQHRQGDTRFFLDAGAPPKARLHYGKSSDRSRH